MGFSGSRAHTTSERRFGAAATRDHAFSSTNGRARLENARVYTRLSDPRVYTRLRRRPPPFRNDETFIDGFD